MSEWIDAAKLTDVPEGTAAEVVVGEAILALIHADGEVHALDGMCAHQGGPLGKGRVESDPAGGCRLTCPWHGWQYDPRSGRQLLSDHIRQRRYPVRIEGDTIQVRLGGD